MSKEYRADEFTYFVEAPTGDYEEVGAKGDSKRKRPITKKIVIDYDKIDSLDLEKRGSQVPFTHKHVVNTPLYMLYYWSPIIGDRACWLYLQLLTYCREDRDFLWDKLEELQYRTNMSRPTLNKHLDILEENNFIIKIHRLNKKDNNRQTSPIIKVRQSIPLLSLEQYSMLSDSSKARHDDFMSRYGSYSIMEDYKYDVNETVGELVEGGEIKVTQKMKRKVDKLIRTENAINYIATKLEFDEGMKIKEFHDIFKEDYNRYMSKPTYDTFMQDSFIFYNKKRNCIEIVVNELARDFFNDSVGLSYRDKFIEIIERLYEMKYNEYDGIFYYSFEEYMLRLERGI